MDIVVEKINGGTRKYPNYLSWLDIVKGMAIILVVIGQVYSNSIVFDWLYSFHMPLFLWQLVECIRRSQSAMTLSDAFR